MKILLLLLFMQSPGWISFLGNFLPSSDSGTQTTYISWLYFDLHSPQSYKPRTNVCKVSDWNRTHVTSTDSPFARTRHMPHSKKLMDTEWTVNVSATGSIYSACSMPQCLPGYFNHSHYLLGSWRHFAFVALGTKREKGWWENPMKCYQGITVITESYTGQKSPCPSSPP